jgi:3-oxoacyl-[acyl-carrier-protein] synthase-3
MSGILALGTYTPQRVMKNEDFEAYLDTSDEWIVTRTGIRERRIAAPDEYTSDLAFKAVEDLLRRHPGALEGVDGVIVATNTPDALFPDTAALVQARFGLNAFAYDLLAGCPGWIYALVQAHALVEAGLARKVLTIGAEALSKILDWNDRATAVLFGDAGGAAVVGKVREGFGFRSFVLGSDGTGAKELFHACVAPRLPDGTSMEKRLHMNGREVFKFAVRVMNTATLEAIEKAGLTPEDIKVFVPHQANLRIIDAARERLGLPWERVVVNVDRYGNTSTASIPLALKEAVDEGRIREGDHVLLVSFGAGLTWAAAVLTWGVPDVRRPLSPAKARRSWAWARPSTRPSPPPKRSWTGPRPPFPASSSSCGRGRRRPSPSRKTNSPPSFAWATPPTGPFWRRGGRSLPWPPGTPWESGRLTWQRGLWSWRRPSIWCASGGGTCRRPSLRGRGPWPPS